MLNDEWKYSTTKKCKNMMLMAGDCRSLEGFGGVWMNSEESGGVQGRLQEFGGDCRSLEEFGNDEWKNSTAKKYRNMMWLK